MEKTKQKAQLHNRGHNYGILIIGALFYGISLAFGRQAEAFGEVRLQDPSVLLQTALAAVAAGFILLFSWNMLERLNDKSWNAVERQRREKGETAGRFISPKICFLILWILYFIVFLGVYPGFFVYDAHDELLEMITRNFSNQHPPVHVLGLGIVIQGIHKVTGNYNLAIAVYLLLQMTAAAAFFTWLIAEFRKSERRAWCCWLLLLYFGIFPVHVMYVLCSVKDGIFAAFLAGTVVMLRRVADLYGDYGNFGSSDIRTSDEKKAEDECAEEQAQKNARIRDEVLLILFASVMMLYRNNGVYAFLVFAAMLVMIFTWKTCRRRMPVKTLLRAFLVLAAPVILYSAVNRGIRSVIRISEVGHREMLAVPIQQMARIYAFDKDSLTAEEQEKLEKYIPADALERYRPKCVDPVKIDFQESEYLKDPAAFYSLYLQLGKEHPSAYMNSWVMTSYGIWYPWTVIDGYKGNSVFTYTYGDSSYFGYETEVPGTRTSFIPVIDRFYRWLSLDPSIQKIPVLHLAFSPGFIVWIYLLCAGYLFYTKNSRNGLPYLLPVLVWMTFLLGPMSLVRYVYYLWILVPLIAADILRGRKITGTVFRRKAQIPVRRTLPERHRTEHVRTALDTPGSRD